jgi:redox-sensitive bicupin YhaK (pirin superfamily)
MRAGSGILHDEGADGVLRREGGRMHGLQLWINLPQGRKMSPPPIGRSTGATSLKSREMARRSGSSPAPWKA